MKYVSRLRAFISGTALVAAVVIASIGTASAAPAVQAAAPSDRTVSGPQAKPPVEPGKVDAKSTRPLGKTDARTAQPNASTVMPLAGNVSGVDFQAPLNYCYQNLVYTPVTNTSTSLKYFQVRFYNQGGYRDVYTSVAAGSTAYPAFYNAPGAYTAYLYVWNGTSYVYDEYKTGTNTCNVSVTRTYNTGGWVQLKIQNLGTAYASQQSTELAPYPGTGTYTGTHYDYPVAGGAAIYRWFSVGTSPYGIVSHTLGSSNSPYFFSGDL